MYEEQDFNADPKQSYPKKYHTKEDKVDELENKLAYLERDINRIKVRMITWPELVGFLALILVLLFWGDKLWACVQTVAASIFSVFRKIFR